MKGELISFVMMRLKIIKSESFISRHVSLLGIGYLNCPNWFWLVKDMK
jgi:hypothetical protein